MLKVLLNKMPLEKDDVIDDSRHYLVTYMNPYGYIIARKNEHVFTPFKYITSDGIILVKLFRFLGHKKITRLSPDFSSYFSDLFKIAEEKKHKVFIVGTKPDLLPKAIDNIKERYTDLNIVGYHSGYFDLNERKSLISEIIDSSAEIVIVGMGAILQERFLLDLWEAGWRGRGYTCGGFIHQTAQKLDYYPNWINKLHLRWLFRIFDEPKLLKRYIIDYPFSIFLMIKDAKKQNLRELENN